MSLTFNRVTIAGNLTRDPEVKTISGGTVVAQFGVAINQRYKNKDGEQKEDTVFVDVEAWQKTAEFVGKYFSKGNPIFIEGKLKFESWQDKDGGKRSKLKIVADNVQFVESKGAGGDRAETPAAAAPAAAQGRAAAGSSAGKGDDEPPF